MASYRYPGTKPFEAGDRHLFFGRQKDIARLSQLISLERMVVLFGKSGMGKTSLLNAGVIPEIKQKDAGLYPIFIRLRSAISNDSVTLKDIFIQNIPTDTKSYPVLEELSADFQHKDTSLWAQFKKYQRSVGTWNSKKKQYDESFVLVFDQFEEFFTHPASQIESFLQDLSELYYTSVPQRYLDVFAAKTENETLQATDDEVDEFFAPLSLKIVFGIRVDQLSNMTRLAPYFPNVLSNTYELRTLRRDEAEDAIVKPAQLSGKFVSPPFILSPIALNKVFDALFDKERTQIECFQLQIVCQWLENMAVEMGKKGPTLAVGIPDLDENKLKEVYDNYYKRQIQSIPIVEDRATAQVILEDKLLTKEDRRFLQFEDILKNETGVSDELLLRLVNMNLIRREVLPGQQGTYYEISHDQFIKPLQKARKLREIEEQRKRIAEEFERKNQKDQKMAEFEQARRLEDVERRQFRVMGKAAQKKQLQFFWNALRRQEKVTKIRGLLIIAAIAIALFGLVGLGIYTVVKEVRESKQQAKISTQIKEANQLLKQVLIHQEQGKPVDPQTSQELMQRYEALQKELGD